MQHLQQTGPAELLSKVPLMVHALPSCKVHSLRLLKLRLCCPPPPLLLLMLQARQPGSIGLSLSAGPVICAGTGQGGQVGPPLRRLCQLPNCMLPFFGIDLQQPEPSS